MINLCLIITVITINGIIQFKIVRTISKTYKLNYIKSPYVYFLETILYIDFVFIHVVLFLSYSHFTPHGQTARYAFKI